MVLGFLFQDGAAIALAYSCAKLILVAVLGMTAGYSMGMSQGYHQGIEVGQAHAEAEALLRKKPSRMNRENLHAMSRNTEPMPAEDEFIYE
jgi:hypothetical protein